MVFRSSNIDHTGSSDQPDRDGTSDLGSAPMTAYVPFSNPLEIGTLDDCEAHHQSRSNPESGKFPHSDPTTATNRHETKSIRYHLGIFWAMTLPYFRENREARCLFAGLIVLMLLDSAATIAFSYLARDFWSALGDKDAELFYSVMKSFLIAL